MEDWIKKIIEKSNSTLTEDEVKSLSSLKIDEDATTFVEKTSVTRIKLLSRTFIPVEVLEKLEEGFKLTKVAAVFHINEKINNSILKDYFYFIKRYCLKNNHVFSSIYLLKEDCVSFDAENKKINISFQSRLSQQDFEKNKNIFILRFKKYGINDIEIVTCVDKTLEVQTHEEIEKEKNRIREEARILESRKSLESEKPKAFSNYSRSTSDLLSPSFENLDELVVSTDVIIHGKVISIDERSLKKEGNFLYKILLSDGTASIFCTIFYNSGSNYPCYFRKMNPKNPGDLKHKDEFISKGDWVSLLGSFAYNDYDKENTFSIRKYSKIKSKDIIRKDDAKEKRIELHTHTKMSTHDGLSEPIDYLKIVDSFNMKAIAFTDHLNVQAFPDIYKSIKKINSDRDKAEKIKAIYGCEIEIIDPNYWIIKNPTDDKIQDCDFVVFDLETTGLNPDINEIIEFGAVKFNFRDNTQEKIDILIKPSKPVSSFTTNLTGISNEMLEECNTIETEIDNILKFIGNSVLVAHNAKFDIGFLWSWAMKLRGIDLKNPVIDTLPLARIVIPKSKNFRLGSVARYFYVDYDETKAHRGDYDAEILKDIFNQMYFRNKEIIFTLNDFNEMKNHIMKGWDKNSRALRGYHTNLLVKNQKGIKDLYKIISYSHTDGFLNVPSITWEKLKELNGENNLFVSACCANSEVFESALTGTLVELRAAIKKYDYIELQPFSSYYYLIEKQLVTEEDLLKIINKIIEIAKEEKIMIVATGDVHYTTPDLTEAKRVMIHSKRIKGVRHPLFDYSSRITKYPLQHLRTTDEMINDFSYLKDSKFIKEIVITNTNKINDSIDWDLEPIKSEMYAPKWEGVNDDLRNESYKRAKEIYGDELPEIVEKRLKREVDAITGAGYGVVYWISRLLVKYANNDGWCVGSRGSVGSSLVATFLGITEVNPLIPHYYCIKCKYSDFNVSKEYASGYDLPNKKCPKCNEALVGDGNDIPFETFLGFKGDKIPDIDLNFPGTFQSKVHDYCKELFGENYCFRAGTISTIKEKTAVNFAKDYLREINNGEEPTYATALKLASECDGVKRTTGQHPGGIVIVPNDMEIEDFTPINFPSDETDSTWKTTHFAFEAVHDNLLKLDILGHDDPIMVYELKRKTGIDPLTVPLNDEKVMSLFNSSKELKIDLSALDETTGAIALPEFGTNFVRGVLRETKPKCFSDLVQVSGLTHGTDVYKGNASELIANNTASLGSVIGCRDSIMGYLINQGLENIDAFKIMEKIRKGINPAEEELKLMRDHNVPEWYIESCLKIKYLFPKAHAVAYVLMAVRQAWFKYYYPEEFYASYLSWRISKYDIQAFLQGESYCLQKIKEINETNKQGTDAQLLPFYEVVYEMYKRKIKVKNIDIEISEAVDFKVVIDEETSEKVIYLPFSVVDGLGESIAFSIIEARNEKPLASIQDLKTRTLINKTQLEIFNKLGIISNMNESNQNMFGF